MPFVAQGRVESAELAMIGGVPRLAVIEQVGAESDARVLRYDADQSSWIALGDGLDRGSKTSFDTILAELQNKNVTVYALQIPDRTGGAYRRNQPKANVVINQLTEGTGGKIFPLEEAQEAAKFICDELRKNRYLLSYFPTNTSTYDARKVFLLADEGISLRTKNAQPPNVK